MSQQGVPCSTSELAGRRDFLRGIAGCFGLLAVGSPSALGQSLLLRKVTDAPGLAPATWTMSISETFSYTDTWVNDLTSTYADVGTLWAGMFGTFTTLVPIPAWKTYNGTYTQTIAGPQTVTVWATW